KQPCVLAATPCARGTAACTAPSRPPNSDAAGWLILPDSSASIPRPFTAGYGSFASPPPYPWSAAAKKGGPQTEAHHPPQYPHSLRGRAPRPHRRQPGG